MISWAPHAYIPECWALPGNKALSSSLCNYLLHICSSCSPKSEPGRRFSLLCGLNALFNLGMVCVLQRLCSDLLCAMSESFANPRRSCLFLSVFLHSLLPSFSLIQPHFLKLHPPTPCHCQGHFSLNLCSQTFLLHTCLPLTCHLLLLGGAFFYQNLNTFVDYM